MTINNTNVQDLIAKVKKQLEQEEGMTPALKSSIEMLLVIVSILVERLGTNSKNSSKPPSKDENRKKESKAKGKNKPGGQPGRVGKNLKPVEDPDIIKEIPVDKKTLPEANYQYCGYEARQVFDIVISRVVTEYRAQVLVDQRGCRFVAPFPEEVMRPTQYGASTKAHSVYMSLFQLIPYNRIEDYFEDQLGIPISAGSIFNFNQAAYDNLEYFEEWIRTRLINSTLIHADETGINIEGKKAWLHCASSPLYTFFYPHKKRGGEALEEMQILPLFQGTLCHDHWKPYYQYGQYHALCNAHHLRELERACENDNYKWSQKMIELLKEIHKATQNAGGCLNPPEAATYRQRFRDLILDAEKECPPPDETNRKGKRGKIPRSKSRNLLERLRDYEDDVLRFMTNKEVPFSNNLAENDIRMTKVQQKISGCFRAWDGAKIFCRVRSYLSTARKHGVSMAEALDLLFNGRLPDFVQKN